MHACLPAGVDIEPNGATQSFVNLTFRRCNSTGNAGAGYMMCVYHLTSDSAPISVAFEDCHVSNVGLQTNINDRSVPGGGFVLSASSNNESRTWVGGSVKWKGGSITDTAEEAIHISHPAPGAAISFEQVSLARNAVNMTCHGGQLPCFPNYTLQESSSRVATGLGRGTPNPIFILANVFPSAGAITDATVDGVTFTYLTVSDSLPRDFVYVSAHSRNVLGSDITVLNTKANGCGKNIVVPMGKPSHFAEYGGNVNVSIARCLPLKTDEAAAPKSNTTTISRLHVPQYLSMFNPDFNASAQHGFANLGMSGDVNALVDAHEKYGMQGFLSIQHIGVWATMVGHNRHSDQTGLLPGWQGKLASALQQAESALKSKILAGIFLGDERS
jgi:hypothetical protein